VIQFIKWYSDLASKYNHKYNYQQAQYKDPEIIKN